jgi:glyoxylase-like metal-dependent hydrolase (beta-lactamase superfamily II)
LIPVQSDKEYFMPNYICVTCGTQFAGTDSPPDQCPICEDERQYVPPGGQEWTTLDALQETHHTVIKPLEPGLTGIGVHPEFAIGQRALLAQTPEGNLLWDCVSLIDDPTIAAVQALGGMRAIAISHPHYYSSMVEWSQVFDAPIHIHQAEHRWVMRPNPAIDFWEGETYPLFGGLTLIRCSGHFEGGQVVHWPAGAEGKGALLSGDIIQVVPDSRYVSFMYSYPNLIPLPASAVEHIAAAVEPYPFDRIYGAWWPRVVPSGAHEAVDRSADRYVRALRGEVGPTREKAESRMS